MMPLNFFIRPLSPLQQQRQLLAHNSRGAARYITTSSFQTRPAHPLALPFVLGLSQQVDWYPVHRNVLNAELTSHLLYLVGSSWRGTLDDLDIPTIRLRAESLPPELHSNFVTMVELHLTSSKDYIKEYIRMQLSDKIPTDVMDRINSSLASLEQSLLEKDPMMPQHLRNTHSLLISYPETVHLLDDKEIALIIDAAEVHTKTEVVKAAAKGKTATKKKIDVSDL